MTWTKLGDEFSDEAAPLSDEAYRTHTEALQWSNRRLLDLFIPKRDLKRFAETKGDVAAAVAELVKTSWWQDCDETWYIGCKFPEWQRDKAQVVHRREQNSVSQRRKRAHEVNDHSLCLENAKCRRLSADDKDADSPADRDAESADDPGRAGTGRVGTGRSTEEEGWAKDRKPEDEGDWPSTAIPGQAQSADSQPAFPGIERVKQEARGSTAYSR